MGVTISQLALCLAVVLTGCAPLDEQFSWADQPSQLQLQPGSGPPPLTQSGVGVAFCSLQSLRAQSSFVGPYSTPTSVTSPFGKPCGFLPRP